MAVTRIKNNQITDATIVASSKLVDYSISAGKIANSYRNLIILLGVLERVIKKCVPDADIAEICAFGDSEILGEL